MAVLCFGLSACAVGKLSSGGSAATGSDQLRQSFLAQAAMLSKCAWDEVRSSPSRFGAWATILMEGRDEEDPNVLSASSEATSPAAGYLALKAASYATPGEQLSAVVADLEEKSAQVDTFIGFADALAASYGGGVQAANREVEQRRDTSKSDRKIIERAVAELVSQKTTYEAVQRRLREDVPELDTSPLTSALDRFSARIDRLAKLAETMVAHSA